MAVRCTGCIDRGAAPHLPWRYGRLAWRKDSPAARQKPYRRRPGALGRRGMSKVPTTAAFVSQKGGVGKSALARLLAIGAIHRGRRTLLADFDLDQLTCVEWGALRMRFSIEPEVDTR